MEIVARAPSTMSNHEPVPPVTPESIRAALDARDAERAALPPRFEIPQDRNEQLIMLDAQEALRLLVQTYTAARVSSWLRFIAAQEGQAL